MFLPSISSIPIAAAVSAGTGYLSGIIVGSSPLQWAKIAIITTVVHHTLFLLLNESPNEESLKSTCISFAFTAAGTDIIRIIALTYFDLITTTGVFILGCLALWKLRNRLIKITHYNIDSTALKGFI